MAEEREKLDAIFDRYREFIEFELKDVGDRVTKLPSIIGFYQSIFYNTKKKYDLQSMRLDRKWQEKYLYYKNEFRIVLNNNEIKSFIEKDLEYLDIKESEQKLKTFLEQIELTLKGLDSMGWQLKTLIEWEKFKQGNF